MKCKGLRLDTKRHRGHNFHSKHEAALRMGCGALFVFSIGGLKENDRSLSHLFSMLFQFGSLDIKAIIKRTKYSAPGEKFCHKYVCDLEFWIGPPIEKTVRDD